MNPRELEEERRLMYVAMTRAKGELFLTRAKERLYFKVDLSLRYLMSL